MVLWLPVRLKAITPITGEIADQLSISPKTVLAHRHKLMDKLGMDSTVALARYALRHGIIGPIDI